MRASDLTFDAAGSTESWVRRNGWSLVIVVAILGLWETYSRYFNPRGDVYFPSITYVIEQSIEWQDMLNEAVIQTFSGVLLGYPLGLVVGVTLGIIVGESYIIRQASLPLIVFLHALPVAILAPLFIIWFGTGMTGTVLFVALTTYFVIFINTITGFKSLSQEHVFLAKVFGATRWQNIAKIKIWTAMPHILAGAKIGVQQAVVGVIVIEFIASGQGLGNLIVLASDTLRDGLMFGTLIIIMVFAMFLYKFVEYALDRAFPHAT